MVTETFRQIGYGGPNLTVLVGAARLAKADTPGRSARRWRSIGWVGVATKA
jgi:hypothetical protein